MVVISYGMSFCFPCLLMSFVLFWCFVVLLTNTSLSSYWQCFPSFCCPLISDNWLIFPICDNFFFSGNFGSNFNFFHIFSTSIILLITDKADRSNKLFFNRSGIICLGVVSSYIYNKYHISSCILYFQVYVQNFGRLILSFDSLKSSCFVISLFLTSLLISLAYFSFSWLMLIILPLFHQLYIMLLSLNIPAGCEPSLTGFLFLHWVLVNHLFFL